MKLRNRVGSIVVTAVCAGAIAHQLLQERHTVKTLNARIATLEDRQQTATPVDQKVPQVASVNDPVSVPEHVRLVTKSENWRAIQEKVTDAVVQVFSQVAEFDFLEPYKTPNQYSAYGSAFFISGSPALTDLGLIGAECDDAACKGHGYLVTNAHVVKEAAAVWIQIPSLGKRIIDVEVVGVSPERDLALLKLTPEMVELVRQELGEIPYLPLGDSDTVRRADEVLALGYPLGQQSLKSTSGVISGRQQHLIQMSAPINPGSSGGPLLNTAGEVIGVNSSGFTTAQNVGYIIPINDWKIIASDLCSVKLLRKPFLGVIFNNATESLTQFLGNPAPGGCYVVEVVKDSTLFKAGVQRGDMIYEFNGFPVDMYGEINVPWTEDKMSLVDYVSRIAVGEEVRFVVYRKGERKEFKAQFSQNELPAIRTVYPGYEEIDYEIAAGMVVMELTINHIVGLKQNVPGLVKFGEINNQSEPALIITHIFPNSQLHRARAIPVGSTINELNGMQVNTLAEFREALKKPVDGKYITIKASDNATRASDNMFVVLPFHKVASEEMMLASRFHYDVSDASRELIKIASRSTAKVVPAMTIPQDTLVV